MTCTPENKSFDSFKAAAALPEHFTEDSCKMWLLDADVQDLVRLLLERKNQQQLLDLKVVGTGELDDLHTRQI